MKTSFYYFTICACAATLILVPVNLTVSLADLQSLAHTKPIEHDTLARSGMDQRMTTYLLQEMKLTATRHRYIGHTRT
jgi:hypothetical protein